MGAFGASQERTFSGQFGYQNLGSLGYFSSPVFGVGCALFAAFFSRESSSRRTCTRIGCGAKRRGRLCRMAALYLLANETVQNQEQQHLDAGTVQVLHHLLELCDLAASDPAA